MKTIYISLYSHATNKYSDEYTAEDITVISVEIDHEANWEMPKDLSSREESNVTAYMSWYIANKWDANDYDQEDAAWSPGSFAYWALTSLSTDGNEGSIRFGKCSTVTISKTDQDVNHIK